MSVRASPARSVRTRTSSRSRKGSNPASDVQYAGTFDPKVGYGGFGGGACRATKTPVVFIHGNGDRAINWASPVVGTVEGYVPPKRSVYDEFKRRGYNDCELFGVTYLSRDEQENAAGKLFPTAPTQQSVAC
jgi:hypothetical protein